jgi:HEAT repeat protein
MTEPAAPPPAPKPCRTARDRDIRRRRIFALKRMGRSNDEIGEAENLTGERIRQIVVENLDKRRFDPNEDHMRLQIARLDAPLRVTAEQAAAGDLRAVDRLMRVMDRLDRYQRASAATGQGTDDSDLALDAKLADLVARRRRADAMAEEAAAALESGENPPVVKAAEEEPREAEIDVFRFFDRQIVDFEQSGQE